MHAKSCRTRVRCSERLRKHGVFPYLKKNSSGKDAEVALTNALEGLKLSRSRLRRPHSPYVKLWWNAYAVLDDYQAGPRPSCFLSMFERVLGLLGIPNGERTKSSAQALRKLEIHFRSECAPRIYDLKLRARTHVTFNCIVLDVAFCKLYVCSTITRVWD